MAAKRQRLKYRIEWKEGSAVKHREGWTWVGEDIPLRIEVPMGPKIFGKQLRLAIVGRIVTEVEPA